MKRIPCFEVPDVLFFGAGGFGCLKALHEGLRISSKPGAYWIWIHQSPDPDPGSVNSDPKYWGGRGVMVIVDKRTKV